MGQGRGTLNTGMRGRQIQGCGGCEYIIIANVGGKCDISHFPREYVLVNAAHPTLLMVPIFQQGDIGFTFFNAGAFATLLVMEDFQGKVMLRLSPL